VTVNAGTLIFESGANLLQDINTVTNTNSGNITFKRNANTVRQDYVYWSSPVEGQNLQSFSPLTLANRFYTINEATNAFTAINPLTSNFTTATRYAIRAPNSFLNPPTSPQLFTGTSIGVPKNASQEIAVTANGAGDHLIGNPYP